MSLSRQRSSNRCRYPQREHHHHQPCGQVRSGRNCISCAAEWDGANLQAYAILAVPPINLLPKQTLRRLQAIEEFTELGSGLNLATRDLEIRGAGNMLGGEQSGFIMEMGFEMYTKILEDAVAELKEQEFADVFAETLKEPKVRLMETQVDADVEAYLPEFYVESDTERLISIAVCIRHERRRKWMN